MSDSLNRDALNERLNFVNFSDHERLALRKAQPVLMNNLTKSLNVFYEKVGQTDALASFFENQDHIDKAQGRQYEHWSKLSGGNFDLEYVKSVTTIGQTHARIGLDPQWYIGGYSIVLSELAANLVENHCKGVFGKKLSTELVPELKALIKASLLDMDYSIATYLEQLESAKLKLETEQKHLDAQRNKAMALIADAFEKLATGDLEVRIADDMPDEYSDMGQAYDKAMVKLASTLMSVRQATEATRLNAANISSATTDLAGRTEQQANALSESSTALHELSESVKSTANTAAQAADKVESFKDNIISAEKVMQNALTSMSAIDDSSKQVGNTVAIIDEIAFQTNLLALNAGVEAARAGEAGKGFAVVAVEVRELAQRSAAAAKDIAEMITKSSATIEEGVKHVTQTGDSLSHFVHEVGDVNELISGIAEGAKEQALALSDVNNSIENLESLTQQNAGMVEETSASTVSLSNEVEQLASSMKGFRTRAVKRQVDYNPLAEKMRRVKAA